jgi:tRNA (guanine-N7-)-methyltransferase
VYTLENNGLYITRKRKLWKFAHFDSYPNCFEHKRGDTGEATYQNIYSYFPRSERGKRRLVLELAAGNAQFSFQLAKKYPEYDFVAVDIKSDRLYTSAKQALEEGVKNIAFVRMSIYELEKVFPNHSVDTIWLTFPDPFMRKRSIRRRLSHPLFLQQYRTILSDTGELKFKTDNRDLFLWSLEQFVAKKWKFQELTFDLHESDFSEDYKIMTHYETKFNAQGIPINFCSVTQE